MIKIRIINKKSHPVVINTDEFKSVDYEFIIPSRSSIETTCSSPRYLDELINQHSELTIKVLSDKE
jgi:hypothetical protein